MFKVALIVALIYLVGVLSASVAWYHTFDAAAKLYCTNMINEELKEYGARIDGLLDRK